MSLAEALALGPRSVVSLVGAGGKTSLMFALARELAASGGLVVTTTTTKILEPTPSQSDLLFIAEDDIALMEFVAGAARRHRRLVTLATARHATGKLTGVAPALVDRLAELPEVSYVIVEADGAAGRPIKAPNATEPVIPASTTLTVAIAGVDALGVPLGEEQVFRAAIAAELLGLPMGSSLEAEAIAALILHPAGLAKGTPATARLVVYLNKVDVEGGLARGRAIAAALFQRGDARLERVVLGRARGAEPVAEVLKALP